MLTSRPLISIVPPSRRSAPNSSRATSVRPAPIRPVIPNTSPRRRSKLTPLTDGARLRFRAESTVSPGEMRCFGKLAFEPAADHQLDQSLPRQLTGGLGRDVLAVAHHCDSVRQPKNFVHPVTDVDDPAAGATEGR